MRDDSELYFSTIDQSLPVRSFVQQIGYCLRYFLETAEFALAETGEHRQLADEDIAALRRWAQDSNREISLAALQALIECGSYDWEELLQWACAEDEGVREIVMHYMESPFSHEPMSSLLESDPDRYLHLLFKAAETRADYSAGRLLTDLSADDQFLDRIWPEMVRLLDLNDIDLNTMLMAVYFEHVITKRNWGADDPHINPWLAGDYPLRQHILLGIASWMGLHEGKLKSIVQALTRAHDPEIAAIAREMLKGKNYQEALALIHSKLE